MNRRSFLKALGAGGGTTALAACGLDDNRYYTPVEQVLPYVVHPDQTTPGTPSYFATAVGRGPSAWPVCAVHREGRVINVAGNQNAWEKSKIPKAVSATALFELQRTYSPDRIVGPQKGGQALAWDPALVQLSEAVKAARAAGKKVAFLGPYLGGTLPNLLRDFTDDNAVFWEPLGRESEALAAKALFGVDALPFYNLANADYVLSFGASFLSDAWGGPGDQARFSAARNAHRTATVARFAAVTPLKDQTAANADDWFACNPGSEALVALAIAKAVARIKSYGGPGRSLLAKGDSAAAAVASGLSAEQIEGIAKAFAAADAVALPGGLTGASAGGTALAAAVYLLNVVSGARRHFRSGGYRGPISSYGDVKELMDAMEAGQVGVLLLGDTDPVHALPNGEQFAAAMSKVDLSVFVSSHANESTPSAGLILPTSSVFEEWGDEEPWQHFRLLRQPAMTPLHDTRSLGDIILHTWQATDAENAPPQDWRGFLQAHWAEQVYGPAVLGISVPGDDKEEEAPPKGRRARRKQTNDEPEDLVRHEKTQAFQRWWEGVLADGYHQLRDKASPLQIVGTMDIQMDGAFSGTGDLALVVFPHAFLLDGRFANEPWAQETPDPMSGHVWDTWALLHPDTAARLGVTDNDSVELTTETGTLSVGIEVHPCVHPDVIAVPLGGGHTDASGRYAGGVGVNVTRVLAAKADSSGAMVWQQARCKVKPQGTQATLHSTFGVYPRAYRPGDDPNYNESDSDRAFAVVVDADEWSKVGDKKSDHPGSLTGIHHLELDERLQKAGVTGFYGLPDHPTYRFGLTVDTNACTGCGACVVACYAENNLPVVGKEKVAEGREMSWIRINRYYGKHTGDSSPSVHFVPMMCQQCGHAPCESVCPVLATYHTIDGLNAMIYNRCVGTRYCSNACPYSARKFNYHSYVWPEPFNLQLNPAVATREMGIMEKCTFCVQRIRATKSAYRDMGFKKTVPAEALEQLTACAEACPSQALTFGNINDPESMPHHSREVGRSYTPIADVNTYPAVNYLAKASFHVHREHHAASSGAGDNHHADENPAAPHGADGH